MILKPIKMGAMIAASLLSFVQPFKRVITPEVFRYFLFTALLALVVILVFLVFEKREKYRAKKRFQEISKSSLLPADRTRSLPRYSIPTQLDVTLNGLVDGDRSFKARLINISPAGFCVQSANTADRLALNTSMVNGVVQTPVNRLIISEIKCMWILEQMGRKLYGFQIVEMDESEFQRMNEFMIYLKEYLLHIS